MLSESIRILNFDDSLIEQNNLIKKFSPEVVDLKRIGPAGRLWLSAGTAREVRNVLVPAKKNSITFTGSGDFHHISYLLIEQFRVPLTLIVFDAHPDWDILPPKLGCGSWVTKALGLENIRKVILLGASSSDMGSAALHTGNLGALSENRVEIYPYACKPAHVILRRVPENISIKTVHHGLWNTIAWQQLKDEKIEHFFSRLLPGIKTRDVYVSIDKDCLKSSYALTNWEEGRFELDELMLFLRLINKHLNIVGLDITGEHSPLRLSGIVKKVCSWYDHPTAPSARGMSESKIRSVNERTNCAILSALQQS